MAGTSVTKWSDLKNEIETNQVKGTSQTYTLSDIFECDFNSAASEISVVGKHVVINGSSKQVLSANSLGPHFGVGDATAPSPSPSILELSGNFVLEKGLADQAGVRYGGSIYASGDNTQLKLTGITISTSVGADRGGAIHITDGASVDAESVTFDSNEARNSGGAANLDGSGASEAQVKGTFSNCVFTNNKCTGKGCFGGALYVHTNQVQATLNSCKFDNNEATIGGAICVQPGCSITMEGSAVFEANKMTGQGSDGKSDGLNAIVIQPEGTVVFSPGCTLSSGSAIGYVDNCESLSSCCKHSQFQNDGKNEIPLSAVGIIIALAIVGVVAIFNLVYYRRRNNKARHYSDLDIGGLLDEPLLADGERRLRSGSTKGAESWWKGGFSKKDRAGSADLTTTDLFSTINALASRDQADRLHKSAWQIPYSKMKMQKRIGTGAFGLVFDGFYGEQPVAIKEMTLSDDPETFKSELQSCREEMNILWELRHPNVLLFYGASFVRREHRELLCLVTELCLGSCDVYISTDKKREEGIKRGMPELTNDLFNLLMKETADGLAFMHSKQVCTPSTPSLSYHHSSSLIHRSYTIRSCTGT
jgi:hypothetical protein